ncbi:energy-coupling factor transporter transmembrane component T family protein [Propionibacterium sp.]|uniref:energy-coupling factor transporter transmembrane component T family protein n=1 Tax=Propionibacterium sp. TaxID=1977903 RepID=UPI0039E8C693
MNRLTRLDVRTKTLVFVLLVVQFLVVDHPAWNGLLFAAILIALLMCRAPLRGTVQALRPLMSLFVFVAVFALFTPPRFHHAGHTTVLFSLSGLHATTGGLLTGVGFIIRILALVVLTGAYLGSTDVDELLRGLDWAHAPYWLGVLVTTAISFVPTMTRRKDLVWDAQRARGADPARHGPFGAVRAFIPIMIPLLTSAITMADALSVALTSRGYGASARMTPLRDLRWHWWDTAVSATAVFACVAWLWARFVLGLGRI